jgi:hypothetical protein
MVGLIIKKTPAQAGRKYFTGCAGVDFISEKGYF